MTGSRRIRSPNGTITCNTIRPDRGRTKRRRSSNSPAIGDLRACATSSAELLQLLIEVMQRVLQGRAMHVRAALVQLAHHATPRHFHALALPPQLQLGQVALIPRSRLPRLLLRLD